MRSILISFLLVSNVCYAEKLREIEPIPDSTVDEFHGDWPEYCLSIEGKDGHMYYILDIWHDPHCPCHKTGK